MISRSVRPPREVDLVARSEVLFITFICGAVGFLFGGVLGWAMFGWNPLLSVILLGVPMGVVMSAVAYYIVFRSGHAAGSLHNPSGDGTPRRYELSREEALIAAGHVAEAAVALEESHERYPGDPRPAVMLAELYRDELDDPERVAEWFRKAAAVPGIGRTVQRQILRTLVELCRDKLAKPELAAPALSRAAQLHAGDRLGYWARQELQHIKRDMEAAE